MCTGTLVAGPRRAVPVVWDFGSTGGGRRPDVEEHGPHIDGARIPMRSGNIIGWDKTFRDCAHTCDTLVS